MIIKEYAENMVKEKENIDRLMGFELAIEDLKLQKGYLEKEYNDSSSTFDGLACKIKASVYEEVIEYLENVYNSMTVMCAVKEKGGLNLEEGEVVIVEVDDDIISVKHS